MLLTHASNANLITFIAACVNKNGRLKKHKKYSIYIYIIILIQIIYLLLLDERKFFVIAKEIKIMYSY